MLDNKELYDDIAKLYMGSGSKILVEELTIREEDKANRMRDSGHQYYMDRFIKDHAAEGTHDKFRAGFGRVTIPVTLNQELKQPHPAVKQFLDKHGYDIKSPEHYVAGKVHKLETTKGDPDKGIPSTSKVREFSIGKVLEKHGANDEIKKAFVNDPARASSKNNDYDIVLSHKPTDVYGASTGRSWVSCANMRKGADSFNGNGPAAKKMSEEINNHTHIAYLVPRGGNPDTDAVARLSFKHHTSLESGHETLMSEGNVYGTGPDDFRRVAEHEVAKLFPVKNEAYMKNTGVYNDNGRTISVPDGVKVSSTALDSAWKKSDAETKSRLFAHVEPDQKYKSKRLNTFAKILKDHTTSTGDFVNDVKRIQDSSYDLDSDMKRGMYRHSGAIRDNMDNVVRSFDINNKEHTDAVKYVPKQYEMHSPLINAIGSKHMSPVRTLDEYSNANKAHELVGKRDADKINIAPDHQFGHDIIKTLGEAGMIKNHSDLTKAYMSLGDSRIHGNIYDHAAHYERMGYPNSAHVMNGTLEYFKDRHTEGGWGTSPQTRRAELYSLTKPENRQRFADVFNEDANEIIKQHGPKEESNV